MSEQQRAPHLSAEQFRAQAHQVVDWIADYWESVGERPVLSQVEPGAVAAAVDGTIPDQPESLDAVLADVDQHLVPGLTHWQHPRFFAYFPANSSPAGVLGDLLSSGIGAQGMLWATSPAVTELEQVVLDQLARALGLSDAFCHLRDDGSPGAGGGVIQDTASTATFTALLAALHRATGGRARTEGVEQGRYTVYASTQAHSSLQKAAMMSGLGERAVRLVDVDPWTQQLDVDRLREAIEADVAAGRVPVMVQACVGTTGTGAVDPVAAIGEVTRRHGVWLHVDAAWAGVAALCPEHAWVNEGVAELADSYVTNPHKWLLTTFDCSTFWVRDRSALVGALSILPEYLRNPATESGAVVDYRDWHPQLGRRFRALKLWTVLRSYGLSGLRAHLRAGIAQAARVAELVDADPRLELAAPPVLGLVSFRLASSDGLGAGRADQLTREVMDRVNASGAAYLSHGQVAGRPFVRWACGGWRTGAEDVEQTWAELDRTLTELLPTR
ncbi:pyridoxal phosphate-dependent decarboxylase family protein [Auraticoccus monumenti]|uniref:Aromatic-L-amino-acid decarboxylase n=1 Tax=Auraticoccus monumenti TaxID=675864 RepID=A0A1G6SPP0_9ACTN|nr:aminotransferase class V-fold PLP-dependent enzyme [Auraticoccus monumenti]SDD18773.1 aromatic-L-amino-acid decarboxylase [Auraticoccus monumenti]